MESYFDGNEIRILDNILGIDFNALNMRLSKIETIFEKEYYDQSIDGILQESRIDESYSLIYNNCLKHFSYVEWGEEYLSSFKYYYSTQRKLHADLTRDNTNEALFDKFKNAILCFECSLLNLESAIIENKSNISNKKMVDIFECCQAEHSPLGMMTEVKKLKDILINSSDFYPITRFSVNRNIFKKTISYYKPYVLHFVCHGEENGDLVFFNGNSSGLKCISPEYLEKVLTIENIIWTELIYLNSCFSNKFLLRISENTCKQHINRGLGYINENNNDCAVSFSELLYKKFLKTPSDSSIAFRRAYIDFDDIVVNTRDGDINYKDNLLFMNL